MNYNALFLLEKDQQLNNADIFLYLTNAVLINIKNFGKAII
jgi:hypothetical protein